MDIRARKGIHRRSLCTVALALVSLVGLCGAQYGDEPGRSNVADAATPVGGIAKAEGAAVIKCRFQ
jgi:hypothetical protein